MEGIDETVEFKKHGGYLDEATHLTRLDGGNRRDTGREHYAMVVIRLPCKDNDIIDELREMCNPDHG